MTRVTYTPMINYVVSSEQKIRTFNIFKALKVAFLPIFLALLVSNNLDQFVNLKIESILRSPEGLSQSIWFYGSLSIFSSIFFPLLISLFASFSLSYSIQDSNYSQYLPLSFTDFLKNNFELSFLETLRSWGKVFLWSFLLIIPGFIKFFFYIPVPFVVFFSKRYQSGGVDALELSQQIAKKHWFWLLIYVVLFTILIPMTLSLVFDQYRVYREHPIFASLLTLVDTIIIIIFHYSILKLILKYIVDTENKTEALMPQNIEGGTHGFNV